MRSIIAICTTILCAGMAQAKLDLRDVQASYGQLGPVRESSEYMLGDEVFYRFNVVGARVDVEGRTRGELSYAVKDSNGKLILGDTIAMQQVPCLGGGRFPARVSVLLGEPITPGKYTLEVHYKDLLSDETSSFQREFTCKPASFSMVELRFYQDAQGRVPAPVGGMLSQTLFVKLRAVGFDKSNDEIDVEMAIEVLDADKEPLTLQPIKVAVHSEKPAEVRAATVLSFSAEMALHRPGEFRLRIVLTDRQSKKTSTFESPLKVVAP